MEFCPKCGYRLELKKLEPVMGEPLVFFCRKCEYKEREAAKRVKPKIVNVIQHAPKEFVAVIGKEEQKLRTLPTIRIKCPKCEKRTAFIWQMRTRGLEESSTQILRCTKCSYTFREYT
ncbi:MAG: RPA12/RPB9/RPC11 RNA polymerase family protein [Candidatus Ranarchaeia archaeon]|jgi:DNA-directed RNA polymerase subunit M